jgi:hypothetical protein
MELALPWGARREWRFQAPRSRAATTGVSTPAALAAAVSSVSKSEKYVTVFLFRDILVRDPDLWIRTLDFRIRILLFSQVTSKMPTKNKFFF